MVTDDNSAACNKASQAVSNALIAGISLKRERVRGDQNLLIRDGLLFDGGLSSILDLIADKCTTKLGIRMTGAVLQV